MGPTPMVIAEPSARRTVKGIVIFVETTLSLVASVTMALFLMAPVVTHPHNALPRDAKTLTFATGACAQTDLTPTVPAVEHSIVVVPFAA